MEFRLLGRLEVVADGVDLTPTRSRERAVLASLLLRRGRVVGVEELMDAVWGENPPPTSRTALHGHVSALRRRLGSDRIVTQAPGYRLVPLPGDTMDVEQFASLVARAGGERPAVRSEMLREALELVRGQSLDDLDLAVGPASGLGADLASERARIEELRLAAEEQRAAADLELGRHLDVIPRLEPLAALHPLREDLRAPLMLALYRAGRQADALRVAQDARRVLAAELGVEPGPVLQRLEQQILNHAPELSLGGPASSERSGAGLAASGGAGGRATPDALPAGVVTFLAVDGAADEAMRDAVRAAVGRHGGVSFATSAANVASMYAFARARDGAAAAAAAQRGAQRSAPAPRIGLHSAVAVPLGDTYLGPEVDRVRRLATAAQPGQVVLSRASRDLLREAPRQDFDVRDLGEHRLADLLPAEPLYQLVASGLAVDFPPVRDLDAAGRNLPVQATPLVGREREVAAVGALLRDPAVRLVTLTGPGGIGKTRLAVHAAAELLDVAPDGVVFVPLEAIMQPDLVPAAIATAAGVAYRGGPSAGSGLVRELRNRHVLLVLDNFEQLLPAGPVVGDILTGAPGVKILLTSRIPLKLAAERVFQVSPLAAPEPVRAGHVARDVGALLSIGSVALFTARARAARPEFALTPDNAPAVAALCRALEGLPLAIELAASRVALMPPEALLGRLEKPLRMLTGSRRQGPERHRALEVTIDWSHELLPPTERRLFASLAVFAGGWTLDAVEQVAGDDLDAIDGLANLVDQSLVRLGGTDADPRFAMLETIREYAAAQLAASGSRAALERRHAAFYLALAEAAEPHLRGNPGAWLARLETDHDNLRAALARLAVPGDGETQARLAGALWRFWYLAGYLSEGRGHLERALAAHPDPTAARARALIGAAVMAVNSENPRAARERASEGLALHRLLGDDWGAAYCQFMLGAAARGEAEPAAARGLFEDALGAFRNLGDDHSALLVSRILAATLKDLGDREGALALYQDNLRRARADQNGRLEASTLGALATIAFDEGRVSDARWMLRESLRLHRELGDHLDTAVDLAVAGRTLAMSGRPVEAARLVGCLAAMVDELGGRRQTVAVLIDDATASLRRQLSEAELARALQEGGDLDLDACLAIALDALI